MKVLQGVVQASGSWETTLIDPEDLGLLRLEATGTLVEGLDFAVFWDGDWREGRCYDSYPDRTFVTSTDAQRLPLCPGMCVRLPLYALDLGQVRELAHAYVRELGYECVEQGTIVGEYEQIASGEVTDVSIPVGSNRPPVEVTIRLSSSGDICLVADTETFLTPS